MEQNVQPLTPSEENGSNRRQFLLVSLLLVLGAAGAGLWLLFTTPDVKPPSIPRRLPPLGAEEKAYADKIEVSNMELSRWANFLGQEIVYLDAVVTNHGDRPVVALELTLEFTDPYGQLVLRQTIRPIGARFSAVGAPESSLGPGEQRAIRAGFENLPPSWNQGAPSIQISGLLLH